jgi:DNA-binding HxlR family transcriptional regulator
MSEHILPGGLVTLRTLAGKWKLEILMTLFSRGATRFLELRRAVGHASPQSLVLQLRALERAGIIQRSVFASGVPHVEYSLTALGESLRPVIDSLCHWGMSYQEPANSATSDLEVA